MWRSIDIIKNSYYTASTVIIGNCSVVCFDGVIEMTPLKSAAIRRLMTGHNVSLFATLVGRVL